MHTSRAWVAAHPSVAYVNGCSVNKLMLPPLARPLTDCLSLKDSRFKYFRKPRIVRMFTNGCVLKHEPGREINATAFVTIRVICGC